MDGRHPTPQRGLDGLTSAELSASRQGLWDRAFTELILTRIPGGTTALVDVGCGLATAAHALLPRLPRATYLGVDADEGRLQDARKLLAGLPYQNRAELRAGRADQLPCQDAQAKFVLTMMTLQHLPDPVAAIKDIARVLEPGGVLVAIEPDNTNNLFYFDAVLPQLNNAFRDLFTAQRRQRRPADIAIGPRVASLVELGHLSVVEFFPHVFGRTKKLAAHQFLDRVKQITNMISADLPPGCAEVDACRAALADTEAAVGGPTITGYACQFVPVFVCVAQK